MTEPDAAGAGLELASSHDDTVRHVTVPGGQLHASTAAALVRLADDLLEDRAVRVVTLTARSSPFCSGPAPDLDPITLDPDPAAAWSRLRVPVIALIDGPCRSVGLELALACDIRLATPDARFAFPDLAAGRLPCWGGTQRLPRAIRPAEATAMLLLGTEIDADRAVELGLVHDRVDDLAAAAETAAAALAARGPLSLELAKEAVHRGAELPLRDGLRLEGDLNHQLAATEDRAEGLQAFFDKRPPDFAGR
ncbi:MAG: enoyl-CoA hydratase/isomerase family protein [Actinomycetota bacterium]